MGSYSSLEVKEYPIFSTKYTVDPKVMTVFREGDKKIYTRRIADRNPLVWGNIDDNSIETAYVYSTTVEYAKQRLEVMGFTLEKAKGEFNSGLQDILDDVKNEYPAENDDKENVRFLHSERKKELALLSRYTFEKWTRTFRTIIESKIAPWIKNEEKQRYSPLIRLVLDEDDSHFYHGFPFTDIRYFLRAVLEIVDNKNSLILDITELVDAGEYNGNEELCKLMMEDFSEQYVASSPIIVLTEGCHLIRGFCKRLFHCFIHNFSNTIILLILVFRTWKVELLT